MNIQLIEQDGKPEWAVLPYETYLKLVEQAEALQDIQDYDSTIDALGKGEEEIIPSEVVYALLDGQNPIRVWREYRGMTQIRLAKVVRISVPYLSQLESGKRSGSLKVLKAISKALSIALDELVVPE